MSRTRSRILVRYKLRYAMVKRRQKAKVDFPAAAFHSLDVAKTLLCCFLSVDFSAWPLFVSAGNIQPSSGSFLLVQRSSRTVRTRIVIGRTRLAVVVLPCVTRTVPCLPFVQVTDSQHNRRHSSGRIPVSA